MKILVTGATGVIGRRVVGPLLRGGHQVTAAGRSRERLQALERLGARPIRLDLFSAPAARTALAGHDVLINLATHIPTGNKALLPAAWRKTGRIRRVASRNLAAAAAAAGVQCMVQEAFAPIYADGGSSWIDENAAVKPAHYNRDVLAAEEAVESFATNGRVGVALRFGYFYGADSSFARDAARLIRKGWAPNLGDPDGYLSSVSHDDAATAVLAALTVPSGVYNIVDDEPLTKRRYYRMAAAELGVPNPRFPPPWVRFLAGSIGETVARSQRISNRKFHSAAPTWRPAFPTARQGWHAMARLFTR